MNKILASCIAVAVIAVAAIGFVMLNNHSSDTNDKETIAVTMSWEQGIVEKIVGDHYNVALMLETGSNPHTAQVTPENIKDLNSAVLYFRIGSHVEWEETLLKKVQPTDRVVDLTKSANIHLLNDEGKSGHDVHVWTSLHNLRSMANVICKEICTLDPGNSKEYESNLIAYKKEVEKVDVLVGDVCKICKDNHNGSWSICVWHPAWQYFCQYANETPGINFQQVSVETSDGSLTPENIKKMKDSKSVFVFTGDNARRDAIEEQGITVHIVDPTARDMLGCLKNFIDFLKSDLNVR